MTEPGTARLSQHLRRNALPLALAVMALLGQLGGAQLIETLRYDRAAILDGQWWRVLSGHIVHVGWMHLAMNVAGLVLVWLLFGVRLSTQRWLVVLLLSALGVSAGLLLRQPDLNWYVGLSGVLHGLFAAGIVAALAVGDRGAVVLAIALVVKLIWEGMAGPMPGTSEWVGARVVTEAHLYGALAGGATSVAALIAVRLLRGTPARG
ncbi:MAG: hypothetical protein AMJ69_04490 [Gammaproteobacteria bacterium SG8_47]|nr:MAG: hypothetical protein AMJ69_04490 [Gammaproteobacteria bacterium SG8_47]